MLTSVQINEAKARTKYTDQPHHEIDDCIRIAYEWLDAQNKLTRQNSRMRKYPLKHIIENWGGRYVSQTDVDVAATLHPDIVGSYPCYNISVNLVKPASRRLERIAAANSQDYGGRYQDVYASDEILDGNS